MGWNNVDRGAIKRHIQAYYRGLFQNGQRCSIPIQQGRNLAAALGYPLAALDFIPADRWSAFAPCGNPLPHLTPAAEDRILNLGCGAAIDSFALAARCGDSLEIVNLDAVFDILQQGAALQQRAATRAGLRRLRWICADGQTLPFAANCFDWVVLNGVLNLFPDTAAILKEISRVLQPSGTLAGADLCCTAPLPDYFAHEKDAWAWCMSGAVTPSTLASLFHEAGFQEVVIEPQEEADMFQRILFVGRKQLPAGQS